MKRRDFVLKTTAAAAGLATLPMVSCEGTPQREWGIQLFTIPQLVSSDFTGTFRKISELGYKKIEFFGPYSFSAPATIEAWKPLATQLGITQNAFYGLQISEVTSMMKDLGLTSPSVHLDILTLRTNLEEAMKSLSQLGVTMVALPTMMGEDLSTASVYYKMAEEFNALGKRMKDYGIKLVFHNHGYEHAQKEDEVPLDILLNNTDPEVVTFELDIFWMQAAGASPIDYLKRYPGRFRLMHVKDAAEPVRFAGDGSTPDQWMPLFPKMADPGTGVFDVKGIIQEGIRSGTEHFFLERDLTPDPETTMKNSIAFFNSIQ